MITFFTRRAGVTLAALAALGLSAGVASADSVAVYNFNDAATSSSTPADTAALYSVDRTTSSSQASSSFDPSTVFSFNGTTVNADMSDAAGSALALRNGTNGANNGGYFRFTADLTNYIDPTVSFAIQRTGTGFNSDQFQYSIDGTNFVSFDPVFTPASSFAVQSFNLSGINGLDNNANAQFQILFNGGSTTSTAGNNRIDNLIVGGTFSPKAGPAPVPEASTMVSFGLMGLLALGGVAVRRRAVAAA